MGKACVVGSWEHEGGIRLVRHLPSRPCSFLPETPLPFHLAFWANLLLAP